MAEMVKEWRNTERYVNDLCEANDDSLCVEELIQIQMKKLVKEKEAKSAVSVSRLPDPSKKYIMKERSGK